MRYYLVALSFKGFKGKKGNEKNSWFFEYSVEDLRKLFDIQDNEHYTTVYDMYLIFQEAVKSQAFVDIIKTKSIDVTYQDANGNDVNKTWNNTNLLPASNSNI